ncbi:MULTISPECIES: hypothetical protein [Candidatus Cardinium]|uniref:hypothetical protein n=1 Tax=Candidatus Cardinium TaxID=273135 RepID=UPI001FA9EFC0|nr:MULTISPECIES: hypothetical protein [Cardinium]
MDNPKDIQEQIGSPAGLRKAVADHIREKPKICRDLVKYQEKLRQLAPLQVPRMGFLPLIPVVKAGLAAWTAYQVYATGKDIVNDQKVQRSWEERNYIDIFSHTLPHLPFWGDAIRGGRALALGDSKGAWLYPVNALFTIYGGKVIGKGSRWIFKKVASESNQLRFWKWLTKQEGTVAKVARNITDTENQSVNFILSGLGKSEARSFAQSMGLSKAQLSSVNSAIKRMTSTSVSKVTQNGSDVVVQIFQQGRNGYQVIETTVRVNGSKQVIQKAYDLKFILLIIMYYKSLISSLISFLESESLFPLL